MFDTVFFKIAPTCPHLFFNFPSCPRRQSCRVSWECSIILWQVLSIMLVRSFLRNSSVCWISAWAICSITDWPSKPLMYKTFFSKSEIHSINSLRGFDFVPSVRLLLLYNKTFEICESFYHPEILKTRRILPKPWQFWVNPSNDTPSGIYLKFAER